jgi:hypothetical protein
MAIAVYESDSERMRRICAEFVERCRLSGSRSIRTVREGSELALDFYMGKLALQIAIEAFCEQGGLVGYPDRLTFPD